MQSIQNKKHRSTKKIIFILLGIVVILAISLAGYTYSLNGHIFGSSQNHNTTATNKGTSTKDTAPSTGTNTKNNLPENTKDSGAGKPNGSEVANQQGSTGPSNSTSPLVASITAANQNDNTLQIRTLIQGVVSNGACALTLSNGKTTITRTASIQPLASTSTCQGFNVAVDGFAKGTWNLTIDITTSNKKAHLTKAIEIT